MNKKKVDLTLEQLKQLEDLWFIYGNHGPKSTLRRHKFIQGFIEHGCDYRDFYKPDEEILAKVDKIILSSKIVLRQRCQQRGL